MTRNDLMTAFSYFQAPENSRVFAATVGHLPAACVEEAHTVSYCNSFR
ncbi:hypothetical protein Poly51_23740 [Rubripirellula tenax]|uniref:Uncharacterized protein n=1 Tax=Rubripirellula tenax TaxID=2528015 RepID=A0A5C6F3Y2_9BACT|nr:hypothetical protein Poly51_23740 [Rubripirellula tenax]